MSEFFWSEQDLAAVRRAYARQMLALAGISDDANLEDALAKVPREDFLGPSPWQIVSEPRGYRRFPFSDPALAYQDVRFALQPERQVNNGSPSLHTFLLHALLPRRGERVAHIGAGSGYYSAVLAQMVGERGHVLAVEVDPHLASTAKQNLAHLPNVTAINGDGAEWPREKVDCVYVNVSVVKPASAWIDNLDIGGRLVFPLGGVRSPATTKGAVRSGSGPSEVRPIAFTRHAHGAMFLVEHRGEGFAARWLSSAFFVAAEGALFGSEADQIALGAAFERGRFEAVRRLLWRTAGPPENCWFSGQDWALCYDEVGAR